MTAGPPGLPAPDSPGVYLMKDAEGRIIYIGKAKSLRRRVRSYFSGAQNYKTQKLVERIADIEFVLTDSESEAFLLESNMIKRHRPRFNIELKDQQRYTYLRVTAERYPRLVVARRTRDGRFLGRGRTYGPFTHGSSKLLTVGALRKAFQIRICKTLPKRVCLEYHLGNCEGPCEFAGAQERYPGHVAALEEVLRGRGAAGVFAEKLEAEMRQAADLEQFERAREIRDTLARLGSLRSGQKMERVGGADEEYFGIGVRDQSAVVMSFRMLNGVMRDSERFFFDLVGDNSFSSFLSQYYSTHRIPRHVVASEEPADREVLESVLSGQAGFPVDISVPSRGRRRKTIDLIMRNVDLVHSKGGDPGLVELKDLLGLPAVPGVIECFDISNHGADYAVGAMSRFEGGRPDRGGYRRFRIRTVSGRDDYAMMAEVVRRRYLRLSEEGGQMPDLVLVDGGRGQLGAASKAVSALGLGLSCASLAKENEEVFVPGRRRPVVIPRDRPSLKILQHARDEAHRFGVAYNRAIRRGQIK